MDRFIEMQTFCAVVEARSFVGAAASLGYSKAAVSRYISELEARLGARLLHRTTRRLALTEEGEGFYHRCKELLAGVKEAEAELDSLRSRAHGLLRINVPVTFGILHLAPLWGAFREQQPEVDLQITLSDRVTDLIEEGYDLAIRIASLPSSTLVSRRLATTRLVVCASPRYLARHGRPAQPADLANHRIIGYSYHSGGTEWTFDGPTGRAQVRLRPWLESNNGDTCRAAALAHQGVAMQPSFLVTPDLRDGSLVELLPDFRTLELGIYAVFPTRKHVPLKVRAIIDFLQEALAAPAWME